MPVKRRLAKRRLEMPSWMPELLRTGERPEGSAFGGYGFLAGLLLSVSVGRRPPAPQEWIELRADLVEEFREELPGRRPWAWWLFDAPEPELVSPGPGLDEIAVMRQRVDGSGSTTGDPRLHFGIGPYVDMFDPPQPDDLPRFESEASYLRRLGLLTRTEARRLRAKDFEPEVLDVDPEELAEMHEFLDTHPEYRRRSGDAA